MIRVLLYGLGPIGAMVARQLAARDGFRVVGGVDVDPAKVGRDVGEISGVEHPLRVKVNPDAVRTIKHTKPDVVVLCTSSSLKSVMPQVEDVLKAKVAIVTTTEELSYPVKRNAGLARKIDAMAKRAKVAVLSTGVNPGFAPSIACRMPGPAVCRSSRKSARGSAGSNSNAKSIAATSAISAWPNRSR